MDHLSPLRGAFEFSVLPALFGSLIVCGLGVPLPEELLFVLAGYFGQRAGVPIWSLCAVGVAGILIGDMIPYTVGRVYGTALLKRPFFRSLLLSKHQARIRLFFAKHGARTIFLARFVAGLRTPTFILAGAMKLRLHVMLTWDALGALISCPVSIWLSYHYGERALLWITGSQRVVVGVALIVALVGLLLYLRRQAPRRPPQPVLPELKPQSPS